MSEKIKRIIIFDFDGTLSEIVPHRGNAELYDENRRLLRDLAGRQEDIVAVLSSRTLQDIRSRIDVPGVFIGGSNGLEWFLPGKGISPAPQEVRDKVNRTRGMLIGLIRSLENCAGVEIEDKLYSVAVHTRNASESSRVSVEKFLQDCAPVRELGKFRGPEVIDIALAPGMDKSAGVRRLCGLIGGDPEAYEILYAGDDENDARAMDWVVHHGGIAITVGQRPLVPGSRVVGGPSYLAGEVRKLLSTRPDSRFPQ